MKNLIWKSRLVALVLMVGMLFAACAPAGPQASQTPAPGKTESTPAPVVTVTDATQNPAVVAVEKDLATRLNVSADTIKVASVEQVEWQNGCLGVEKPDVMCTQMIVPGYRIALEAGGSRYEYHTNQNGQQFALAEGTPSPSTKPTGSGVDVPVNPADLPPAVLKAREALAQQLQAKPEDIKIVKVDQVNWPNGCLGVEAPGRMCTQMIVPGYRVIFSYNGKQYEIHTDEAGGASVQADSPLPQTADKVITWQQIENNTCSRVEIGVKSAAFGPCRGALKEAPIQPARLEELRKLLSTYVPFQVDTPSGSVFFNGQGTQPATAAEQRSIAEWAKLVKMEAESGRTGAAWELALGWHREGGIAGFCDDLGVYLSGWAQPSSCKSSQPSGKRPFRLNSDQLTRLFMWVDKYQSFEYEAKDPAGASDAMTVRLSFTGSGSEQALPEVQAEIAQFAGELFSGLKINY